MTVKIYYQGAQVASRSVEFSAVGDSDTLFNAACSVVSTCSNRVDYRDYYGLPSWQLDVAFDCRAANGKVIEKVVTSWTGSGEGPQPPDDEVVFVPPPTTAWQMQVDYHNTRRPEGTWAPTFSVYVVDAPRVPTHRLVNSFDREQVVHLVHDPATGLLVGDY